MYREKARWQLIRGITQTNKSKREKREARMRLKSGNSTERHDTAQLTPPPPVAGPEQTEIR